MKFTKIVNKISDGIVIIIIILFVLIGIVLFPISMLLKVDVAIPILLFAIWYCSFFVFISHIA
jgi:hypothetical protein